MGCSASRKEVGVYELIVTGAGELSGRYVQLSGKHMYKDKPWWHKDGRFNEDHGRQVWWNKGEWRVGSTSDHWWANKNPAQPPASGEWPGWRQKNARGGPYPRFAIHIVVPEGNFPKTSRTASFGEDGMLYAFGTDFGKRSWNNPSGGTYLQSVNRSAFGDGAACVGPAEAFTGRSMVHSHTRSAMGSYYAIELQSHEASPTHYALMCYGPGGGHFPHYWNFEASVDGQTWTLLREHKGDRSIWAEGKIHTWPVAPTRAGFYRHFRVVLTGPEKRGRHYLCLSGFEMWGSLRACGSAITEKNSLRRRLEAYRKQVRETEAQLAALGTLVRETEAQLAALATQAEQEMPATRKLSSFLFGEQEPVAESEAEPQAEAWYGEQEPTVEGVYVEMEPER